MNLTRRQKALKYIPCPTCGAKRNKPCTTRNGGQAYPTYLHQARLDPFEEEWMEGYRYARKVAEDESEAVA